MFCWTRQWLYWTQEISLTRHSCLLPRVLHSLNQSSPLLFDVGKISTRISSRVSGIIIWDSGTFHLQKGDNDLLHVRRKMFFFALTLQFYTAGISVWSVGWEEARSGSCHVLSASLCGVLHGALPWCIPTLENRDPGPTCDLHPNICSHTLPPGIPRMVEEEGTSWGIWKIINVLPKVRGKYF